MLTAFTAAFTLCCSLFGVKCARCCDTILANTLVMRAQSQVCLRVCVCVCCVRVCVCCVLVAFYMLRPAYACTHMVYISS